MKRKNYLFIGDGCNGSSLVVVGNVLVIPSIIKLPLKILKHKIDRLKIEPLLGVVFLNQTTMASIEISENQMYIVVSKGTENNISSDVKSTNVIFAKTLQQSNIKSRWLVNFADQNSFDSTRVTNVYCNSVTQVVCGQKRQDKTTMNVTGKAELSAQKDLRFEQCGSRIKVDSNYVKRANYRPHFPGKSKWQMKLDQTLEEWSKAVARSNSVKKRQKTTWVSGKSQIALYKVLKILKKLYFEMVRPIF